MAHVLLSYKSGERATAEALAAQLADAGFRVGLVTRQSGETPSEAEIDANAKEIDAVECVVTLWSRSSAGADDVLLEAQRAASQNKLILADLQGTAPPPTLAGQQVIDMSSWLVTREAADLGLLEIAINSVADGVRARSRLLAPDIYFAYQRENAAEAEAIVNMLEGAGYDVWWDRKIRLGTLWEREIGTAFDRARLIVLLATRQSAQAGYTMVYFRMAIARGATILILELEPIPPDEYALGMGRELRLGLWTWQDTLHPSWDRPETRAPSELERLHRAVEGLIGKPAQRKSPHDPAPPPPNPGAARRPGHDVFVSYKREDRPKVAPYVERLTASGLQVWWDALIATGANWGLAIERALKLSRSVAVFWTPQSVASEEVYTEANYGLRIDSLFPVLLEPCEIPERMKRVQYLDLTLPHPPRGIDDLIREITQRIGAA